MNLTRPSTLVPYVAGGAGLYQGLFERARAETDPTAVVGPARIMYLRRHFSIRPEATFRFVIDRSKIYRVATITLAVTYHFEEHAAMNAKSSHRVGRVLMRIREIMTEPVETVAPSMPLDQAAGLMRALRVHHLVVKDGSKTVGVLSASDLPKPGAAHDGASFATS